MKMLFASLFAALFALSTYAVHAAVQAKDVIVAADEETTDGDKAPITDTEKKDDTTLQSGASTAGGSAPSASDEETTDADKAPSTDKEQKDDEDQDKDSQKSD